VSNEKVFFDSRMMTFLDLMRGRAAPNWSEVISMNDFPTLAFLASGPEFLARIRAGTTARVVRSSITAPTKNFTRRRRRDGGLSSSVPPKKFAARVAGNRKSEFARSQTGV
jgi:hypothetical protein